MKEIIMKRTGGSGNTPDEIKAFVLEWTDSEDEEGITKEEYFAVLDKASQPVKTENESDSK